MADFFSEFPKIEYDGSTLMNILTAFSLKRAQVNKSFLFQVYTLKDDDIPEVLADRLYNDASLYWNNLFINERINPYYDWVLEDQDIEKYCKEKYKYGERILLKDGTYRVKPLTVGLYGIHHFYNVKTETICDDVLDIEYRTLYQIDPLLIGENIIPISNFQYEKDINFEKRKIVVVSPNATLKFNEDARRILESNEYNELGD